MSCNVQGVFAARYFLPYVAGYFPVPRKHAVCCRMRFRVAILPCTLQDVFSRYENMSRHAGTNFVSETLSCMARKSIATAT